MNGIEGVSLVSCKNCFTSGTLLRIPLQFHCSILREEVKSVFDCKDEGSSEESNLVFDSVSVESP